MEQLGLAKLKIVIQGHWQRVDLGQDLHLGRCWQFSGREQCQKQKEQFHKPTKREELVRVNSTGDVMDISEKQSFETMNVSD